MYRQMHGYRSASWFTPRDPVTPDVFDYKVRQAQDDVATRKPADALTQPAYRDGPTPQNDPVQQDDPVQEDGPVQRNGPKRGDDRRD
jgi:hypothetical protein